MVSAKTIVILILFLFKSCINAKPPENLPDVREKMIELLITCFADRVKTVITTSDLSEIFSEASRDSIPIPLNLIDHNVESNDVQRVMSHLGTFVFAPESTKSFEIMLRASKSSPWWHINALFFIIGNVEEGCEPAAEILTQTWRMNLLSTFYLCYDRDDGVMLYIYNPYTNRAPHPWKEIEESKRKPDDPWTLYARRYLEGPENCANLSFDKAKFLNGYKIKSIANTQAGVKWIENKTYNFESLMEKHTFVATVTFMRIIFSAMNTTVLVNYDYPGFFHNGIAVGFLAKLMDGSYDIALNGRPLAHNVSGTYPFIQEGARILTQQRNFLLPEEKIFSFYSIEIWYLTGIVLLISFVFILVIYKKRLYALAAFDVLRLLLSSSLFLPLNRTATRIFFFCVFQLIIILHATFQGNLAAFLTKPERLYVDNIEDLQTYQYDVYVPSIYQNILNFGTEMRGIKYVAGIDCAEYVINNPSAACIQIPERLIHPAVKHYLHVSQSILPVGYGVLWCRENWPLKEKFDLLMSRLVEAGLYDYWSNFILNIPLEKLHSKEDEETAAQYRPVQLADLAFAFRLLGIGLGISTLVFMIEMFPRKKCLRLLKKMKYKCSMSSIISKLRWRR